MKPEGIKSLGLDAETHKAIKLAAADREVQMKDLLREAWEAYVNGKVPNSVVDNPQLTASIPSAINLESVSARLAAVSETLAQIAAEVRLAHSPAVVQAPENHLYHHEEILATARECGDKAEENIGRGGSKSSPPRSAKG